MLSLIMDTSNQYLMVALYEDGHCLQSLQELGSQRQSEHAIPYLAQLLSKYHKELLNVDEMIITRGPGSYTGERVAMTIAKTLSVISPIQIKAISSLQAYAGMQRCVSVIDARSQKLFVCAYDQGKALSEEMLLTLEEFEHFMQDHLDFTLVGQTQLLQKEAPDVDLAKNLYELSQYILPIENVDALVPCYLKDVEAKKICL